MGMSASQARLLQLQARQSNLEYQGQQINQERTILSQQCTSLYNSLLEMQVPTPPSTSDYTTIVYSGVDGASSFTIGNIVPESGTYICELKYKKTGHYVEEEGSVSVAEVTKTINAKKIDNPQASTIYYEKGSNTEQDAGTGDVTTSDILMVKQGSVSSYTEIYELRDNRFIHVTSDNDVKDKNKLYKKESGQSTAPSSNYYNLGHVDGTSGYGLNKTDCIGCIVTKPGEGSEAVNVVINTTNLEDYFVKLDDGTYHLQEGYSMYKKSNAEGSEPIVNPDYTNDSYKIGTNGEKYYISGSPCMRIKVALEEQRISSGSYDAYLEAIKDAFPEYSGDDSESRILSDFAVYFTQKEGSTIQVPHFVKISELATTIPAVNGVKYTTSYDYSANGTYTQTDKREGCQLSFDTSGRITEIQIPTRVDDDGTVLSYKTVPLEATTTTDNAAYQDAYNKYEYAQYEYDKKQQEINAKTEIIQQEDRNLELKLQRLDNERTQITTEIEAVDKVIKDNIEDSYKTFSG